ncbi:hypothetical protein O9993_09610 [Vibrio lentus]|nr:hypothetical protein [Vibrio lentus]
MTAVTGNRCCRLLLSLILHNSGRPTKFLKLSLSLVAQGIEKRATANNTAPMNIIAAENMVRGTSQLKAAVLEHLFL